MKVPRWAKMLLAILLGNLIYLVIAPHLPSSWRHDRFDIDIGLGVDFALCVLVYQVVRVLK